MLLLPDSLVVPPRIPLAHTPTPFRPLDRLSQLFAGPRIWLKCDDMSGSVLSGNKVRKLEYLAADALSRGCERLITCGGLQSNHCRATAAVAASLGLSCHLVLRGSTALLERAEPYTVAELGAAAYEGNLLLDRLFSAQISVYSPAYYARNIDRILEQTAQQYQRDEGQESCVIPVGGSNPLGLWAYIHAAVELEADFAAQGIDPSVIVCATGSGGTQGGLSLGFHLLGGRRVVSGMAVCDSEAYFQDKIRADVRAWQGEFAADYSSDLASTLRLEVNDRYIGPGYAQTWPELLEFIRLVARTEGVVLDPVYTGKAFFALAEEIKAGSYAGCKDIVFVHTGGIFGLFPFSDTILN